MVLLTPPRSFNTYDGSSEATLADADTTQYPKFAVENSYGVKAVNETGE